MNVSLGDVVLYRNTARVVCPGIVNAINRDGSVDIQAFPPRSSTYNIMSAYFVDADDHDFPGWFHRPPPGIINSSGSSAVNLR